jgi:hypothetical protein
MAKKRKGEKRKEGRGERREGARKKERGERRDTL